MLGFTRCASTACFTQATEYVCGVPLCGEHLAEMTSHFAPPPEPPTCSCSAAKTKTAKAQPARRPGEVRITSRVKLSPLQGAVDPATALDLGCVYYVTFRRNPGMVKIGTTTKASTRFRTLCSQSGDRLRLLAAEPGGRDQEAYRHQQFAGLRLQGTEYFEYTKQIVDHIAELRELHPYYRGYTNVGRLYD
ncbi:GIY-YIG nuclease family protein [Streptomyces sp. BE133]|uniref:GIY-YIG nuclease family protein n=1 Tax=Streptomyces sp. BE133 TaxID=3002523 RepID=UPI002E77BD58|nr:GIY-YIG nuclease family protein [Streptomyces sp. BE133]MEE1812639.1 GIY-YIG nuclease family protein [Streptomyces sp. BE133]